MQSVATVLQDAFTADVRKPKVAISFSWLKVEAADVGYAIVGSSTIDGPDIIQGASAVITNSDLFSYMDESQYVMRYEYDRRLDEPRGGISYAVANLLLDNITKRFSPNYNATIGTAIEARRPMRGSVGLQVNGVDRFVRTIVGLTAERPQESKMNKTVSVEVYDYITFINNSTLSAATYENQRSDQIIESILTSLGFGSSQYVLDTGLNTIPFAWFDKTKSAGRRIREICESEEAHFYQDENGVLRFENRNHYANYPHATPAITIDPGDIVYDDFIANTRIINRSIVIAKPRKVDGAATTLWTHGATETLTAGQTLTIWAAFYDGAAARNILPVKEITTPAASTDYTANSISDGSGSDLTADISVTVTNFVETAKIEITNNGAGTAYLTLLQLRGKAARVTQALQAVVEDANSINKFEAQEYVIENDLIQTRSMAESIAQNLVDKYSTPMSRRKITIPGIATLQLKDMLKVTNPNPENLIPNPSFENGTTNWSVETSDSGSIALTTQSDTLVPAGYYIGKVTTT